MCIGQEEPCLVRGCNFANVEVVHTSHVHVDRDINATEHTEVRNLSLIQDLLVGVDEAIVRLSDELLEILRTLVLQVGGQLGIV